MADEYIRTEGDYQYWRTPEGDEYKRWAPGNSQDKKPNTLAERHPNGAKPISPDNSHELLAKREAYRMEAMDRVPPSRYGEVADRMASLAMTDPDTKSAVAASGEVRQLLGLSGRHAQTGDGQPIAIQVNLGADLLQAYADRMIGDVIDVSTAENEDL